MMSNKDFAKKQILLLYANKGDKLSFKNDNVVVRDKNGALKHQSTCYRLFAIYIIGNLSITTGLIQRAKKFGFSIVFFNSNMKVYHIINGLMSGNTLLNEKQYLYKGTDVAQQIVYNKISNQQAQLKQVRYKSDYLKNAIKSLEEYKALVFSCEDIQQMMAYEGNASRLYFKSYFNNVPWNGRKPRVKADMVNALLDIGYTILFNYIETIVSIYGFDLYIGVLHRNFYMRKSLVCDLVEPFRVIIDAQTKKGINLKQFKEDDFKVINCKWTLDWTKSADYTMVYLQAIMNYKEQIFQYIQDYYRAFMKQLPGKDFPLFLLGGS